MKILIYALALYTIFSGPIAAFTQPRGYITSSEGGKCWFNQTTDKRSRLHSLEANTQRLVFDDPTCVKASGWEFEFNAEMIGNFISRGYSHSDAAFKTEYSDRMPTSSFQVRGWCIQSATYPIIGIAIEFVAENDSIVEVWHASTVMGCKK
jgi:hypothetical protein